MKKILVITLIAALALTLFACGQPKTDTGATEEETAIAQEVTTSPEAIPVIRENYDKADAYITSLIDAKGITMSEQDDENGAYLYKYYSYDKDIGNVDISKDIAIDGNTITIAKTTEKEIEDFGLRVEKSSEKAEPDMCPSITLYKDDKFINVLFAQNTSGKEEAFTDYPAYQIMATGREYCIPFTYSGLTIDSSLKDVLDALGMPNTSITLSSSDSGTRIDMSYVNNYEEGDQMITFSVTVSLTYDAEKNSSVVEGVNMQYDSNPATPE